MKLLRNLRAFSQNRLLQKSITTGLSIAVWLFIGYTLVVSWAEAEYYFQRITPQFLIGTILLYFCAFSLNAAGWSWMIQRLSGCSDLNHNLWVYFYSMLVRRLPGSWWYLLSRTQMNQRRGITKRITLIASGYELTLLIVASMIVATISMLLISQPSLAFLIGIGLFVAAFLGIHHIFRFIVKISTRTHVERHSGIHFYELAIWILLYCLSWISSGLALTCLIQAMYVLTIPQVVWIVGAWALSGGISAVMVILPIGGGLRDVSLVALLSSSALLGLPLALAVPCAIMMRLLLLFGQCICAGLGMLLLYLFRTWTAWRHTSVP
jgi:hypothetical protein